MTLAAKEVGLECLNKKQLDDLEADQTTDCFLLLLLYSYYYTISIKSYSSYFLMIWELIKPMIVWY